VRLLTAEEVAERLRVTKSFVYDQARAGNLPHVRVGRYVRFHADDIDAWINAQRVAVRRAAPTTNGRTPR
jgi:excisionase family DNA binding protein